MSATARELEARGFAVLPTRLAPGELETLSSALDRLRADVGAVRLYAEDDVVLGDDVKVSPVGLTFFGVLGRAPELASLFVREDVVPILREVLGSELELEQACGVISDESRPFFFWHNHVGGIDGEDFRARAPLAPSRIERLVVTFYATPLDTAHGAMLLHPRAVGDALWPPHPPGRTPWPDATVLDAPAGSIVVLDEATWHAVAPMEASGVRRFVAFFVRRADLPPTRRVDTTIAPALAADAQLASIYRAAAAVDGAPRGRG